MIKSIFKILLLLSNLLFSQSITGIVENDQDAQLHNAELKIFSNSPVYPRPAIDSLDITQDGKFHLSLNNPAFYLISIAAENHQPIEVPLYIYSDEEIELQIQLIRENEDSELSNGNSSVIFKDEATITAYTHKLLNSFKPALEEIVNDKSASDDIRIALAEWALVKLTKETNLETSQNLLEKFPPASPVWSISPSAYTTVISVFDKAKQLEYLKQSINSHKDETIKPYLYLVLFSIANEINKSEIVTDYYPIFEANYSESRYYKNIKSKFSPDRIIQKGNEVPDFRFVSIDDSSIVITKSKMKGEIYLIDFWGSWCLPCVKEMKNLHQVHEKYGPLGLKILSISLDMNLEDAIKFREEKWPMPWFNSFVEYKPDEKVVQDFELASIPKPILVNSDGIIIAEGNDLRGDNLGNVLQVMFEK